MQRQIYHLVYQIRKDHPTMGARDMYYKLGSLGMGRDKFELFCKAAGLMLDKPRSWIRTTDSSGVVRFEDLRKNLVVTDINQLWQSDITYYEVNNRFYYLTFIQDAFSKLIVGYTVSKSLQTEQTTLPALKQAIRLRKGKNLRGLVFHSDGGGQYYAKAFLAITSKKKMRNSMCEYAWDNGMAERLNGVIKNNYLKHRNIKNFDALQKEVDRTVQLYNHEKPHKGLHRKTPVQFEADLLKLHQQTKPTMKKSSDANFQDDGASSPLALKQTKPQNRNVSSANEVKEFKKAVNVF